MQYNNGQPQRNDLWEKGLMNSNFLYTKRGFPPRVLKPHCTLSIQSNLNLSLNEQYIYLNYVQVSIYMQQ